MARMKNSDSEIIIYTHTPLLLIANILLVFISLTFIGLELFVSITSDNNIWQSTPYLIISIFPVLILFYAGSRKVIFDKKHKNVYLKYLFLRKKLFPFSEIKSLRLIGGSTHTYSIFSKNDPYGKGVSLTLGTNISRLSSFERNILPQINDILLPYLTETKEETITAVINDIRSYKYYTVDRNIIKLNQYGIIHTLILIVLGLSVFIVGIMSEDTKLLLIPLPMLLFGLTNWTRCKYFNKEDKTLNISYWFFIKKKYPLTTFQSFTTVRKTNYGVHDGTDVKMNFDVKGNIQSITLRDFNQTKKIESFLSETKTIFQNIMKS